MRLMPNVREQHPLKSLVRWQINLPAVQLVPKMHHERSWRARANNGHLMRSMRWPLVLHLISERD